MYYLKRYTFILFCVISIVLSSCKDKWEEHTAGDAALQGTVLNKIKADSRLSNFYDLIVKAEYEAVLSSSQNFTVWAPTNEALASLDANIVSDKNKARTFVENHITFSSYSTYQATPGLWLKSLNGKNLFFSNNTIEENAIISANQHASNGVLHLIGTPIRTLKNIYEHLLTESAGTRQRDIITSWNRTVFDPSRAVITGYTPSGKPIYEEGTDSSIVNSYLNRARISNEDSVYTYFVLTNTALADEELKLKKYFETASSTRTDSLTRYSILFDLAVSGIYTSSNLPDSLMSIRGVKIHVNPGDIISSHRSSNGIVHYVNKISYNLVQKLGVIMIEGESGRTLSTSNLQNNTVTRRNPDGVTTYTQVRGLNFGTIRQWYQYARTLNKVKYNVYWRAMRDFDIDPFPPATPVYFRQKVTFGAFNATGSNDMGYKFVNAEEVPNSNPKAYRPIYNVQHIGTYTPATYGSESIFVVSNDANASDIRNSIVFDYIMLVPVIE